MQKDDLRSGLQRRLGAPVSARLWNYLDRLGFVGEALDMASDTGQLDYLENEAREILAAGAPESSAQARAEPPAEPEPEPGQERAWALSQLVAVHAGTDPEVVAFRQRHLADQLVEWVDLDIWMNEQVRLEGQRSKDLTVVVPAEYSLEHEGGRLRINPPLETVDYSRIAVRTLEYALPDDEWVRRVVVTAGGTLDRLRGLAENLANSFGWKPAQGSVFVLCGVTPLIPTVRITASQTKVRHNIDLAWARRITLDVDPAATPQQVLDAFQQARRQQGLARLRPLTVKHLRLAVFAGAEHADKPWAMRMGLWNRSFAQWRYTHPSNFRRDALRAQAHVLYPGRHRGSAPLRERSPQ
jgi:hypothetical protein